MGRELDRRTFLGQVAVAGAAASLTGCARTAAHDAARRAKSPLFRISIAQWSLHRRLFGRQDPKITNLDFPREARALGIDAVEYVNQFFKDKAQDTAYLADLKKRCNGEGVKSLLIMCDGLGRLGDPDNAKRTAAIEKHLPWLEAAKFLGCHSIRVNAASAGSYEEQTRLAADGLGRLTEFGAKHDLNVIVENHGGLSSNGAWLAGVMKTVNHPRCGTLPDFGNFRISRKPEKWYDRYQGVKELMPFAKAVSAKSHDFDEQGNETHTDFRRMMKIVLDAGYRGYVGVEYEGGKVPENQGIVLTRKLLERVRAELAPSFS
ncbi:MAG: sugar phosphate isomerase/epimerase [Phycisphaerae bacterium]|nr:sugar phosphate isomerase/epimerase [Phycisphaerae bacterium]